MGRCVDTDDLLYSSEVADLLGVTPGSFRVLRSRNAPGKVADELVFPPPVKGDPDSGAAVYARSDVLDWMLRVGRSWTKRDTPSPEA